MTAIQAVIWDLGGVIVRTFDRSARTAWEARLGLQEYQLERIVFGSQASRKAGIGEGDSDQVWAAAGEALELDE